MLKQKATAKRNKSSLVKHLNHPAGDPAPSAEDIDITRRLKEIGDLIIGVRVLDHVILADGKFFSFSDKGML